ncbi:MAG: hypothetical protein NVSMB68_05510 [Thermoanaerobaculia bacterium]
MGGEQCRQRIRVVDVAARGAHRVIAVDEQHVVIVARSHGDLLPYRLIDTGSECGTAAKTEASRPGSFVTADTQLRTWHTSHASGDKPSTILSVVQGGSL